MYLIFNAQNRVIGSRRTKASAEKAAQFFQSQTGRYAYIASAITSNRDKSAMQYLAASRGE